MAIIVVVVGVGVIVDRRRYDYDYKSLLTRRMILIQTKRTKLRENAPLSPLASSPVLPSHFPFLPASLRSV